MKTHKHPSQTGIASIIGTETKKVLDSEVISFCKGCEQAKKLESMSKIRRLKSLSGKRHLI